MPLRKAIEQIIEKANSGNVGVIEDGINQLESLLKSLTPSIQKSHTSGSMDSRLLAFITLQENFQYNLCSELIPAYRTLQGAGQMANTSTLIQINTAMMGLLLIHPESRNVFSKKANMSLILGFLDPDNGSYQLDRCASFVSLLIHILLRNLRNMRVFEACGGCMAIIRLLQLTPDNNEPSEGDTAMQQTLHFKVVEFLIFYMTDESEWKDGNAPVRTVSEKAGFIKPEFPAIEDLIENLNDLSTSKSHSSHITSKEQFHA
ncbi:hypothetical protein FT663_00435 [Candidozyma haemuli var. vulneris]|uniref:Cell division control protein 14 n=1 Tax=Candidozyma haemuli TaxID=45357 RepID=A0A2V1ARP4_9ASCO|nr:hypothetical protein CXQ85_002300 [[Candida] haemuloni]KAF3993412.1 hypothetical protein FT662_00541 [[Candida] haemuloni var. vulneris]KAF3995382.1 hypothetical protein FT663_00435 [[Candida] haemuloni var. vulneris]PVH20508.1 hypothetical protein CXQ85_002300 [[Candida] haemuloni]